MLLLLQLLLHLLELLELKHLHLLLYLLLVMLLLLLLLKALTLLMLVILGVEERPSSATASGGCMKASTAPTTAPHRRRNLRRLKLLLVLVRKRALRVRV